METSRSVRSSCVTAGPASSTSWRGSAVCGCGTVGAAGARSGSTLRARATCPSTRGTDEGYIPDVKELVYHRQLLPALERHAARVGFHDGDYHGTWEQHGDRVLRLANALSAEVGVEKGDRVA